MSIQTAQQTELRVFAVYALYVYIESMCVCCVYIVYSIKKDVYVCEHDSRANPKMQ